MRDPMTEGPWLHAVLESAPVMLCVEGDPGNPPYFNRRWLDFAGDAATGSGPGRWHDGVHPDDRERIREVYERAADGRIAFDAAFRFRSRDGTYRTMRAAGSPLIGEQGFRGYVVTCRDVAEDEVQEGPVDAGWSGAQYRELAEALPALVFTASPNGEVDYCNARLLDYCGVKLEDLRGARWIDFIHPDDVRQGRETFVRRLRELRPFVTEYRIRRSDGVYRWHLTQTAPLLGSAGSVRGWLACSIDVDDRRRAEDEVRMYVEELDRANAAKDEFLTLMSHELRTPMTTIYGNAHVLRRVAALDSASIQAALADIERDAIRLQRLLDNVFVLARADASVATEPVSLSRAVRRGVADHGLRYPERRVDVEIDPELGPARGDADCIHQVMRNLLANAERSSPLGTRITVKVQRQHERAVVRVLQAVDAGCTDLSRVFNSRSDGVDRDRFTVADIGLIASRRLIHSLAGEIWARERDGGGTEVGFFLPLETEIVA
jgi:PAS domain S-box-containing protein